jgi:hypothetical protein
VALISFAERDQFAKLFHRWRFCGHIFLARAKFCPIAVAFVANTLYSVRVGEFNALVKADGRADSTAVCE